jgi:hypothetical protein
VSLQNRSGDLQEAPKDMEAAAADLLARMREAGIAEAAIVGEVSTAPRGKIRVT